MFLSDHTLRRSVDLWSPVIDENIQPCSVDFTLLQVGRPTRLINEEGLWIIYPNEFVLASTVESVNLPAHIGARVEGKSSLGRQGLFIHVTAGWIDPGFRGQITLELFNASSDRILLRPGQKICQMAFFFLDRPAENPYTGKYQDQLGVTEAR
jgi:dCTP deaminase